MAAESNTKEVASSQERPGWTHVLPSSVRSLGRPLLHKWRYFYGVSREKLREKLAAPSVTSYLMGGCANQIFQYATGLALAQRLGVDLKLDISWYETAKPNQPRMYSLGLFKGVDAQVVHTLCGQIIREEGFPRSDLKLDISWYETAKPNQPRMYSLGLFKGVDAQVVHTLCGQIIREEGFPYKP